MKVGHNRAQVYLFLILSLGTGLRLYKLGSNSFWGDEAAFIFYKRGGLFDSLEFMRRHLLNKSWFDIKSYGYYLFTTFWSSFARGDFMLRLSSVIFGALSIILIYKVGKLFFDKKTGLIAAFILAVSPFHIYYSQEFRMYALMSLLTLASAYSLGRFMQSGKYKFLFGYLVSHVLNIYTHLITILVLFAQSIFFIFCRKKYRMIFKRWIIINLGIVFLIAPAILMVMLATTQSIYNRGNIEKVFSLAVSPFGEFGFIKLIPIYTLKNFCAGYNAPPLIGIFTSLLFIGLFIFALVRTKNRESLDFCLCCLCIPVLVMYLGQRFIYADRYLIPSSVFLYLVVSSGIANLKKPLTAVTLILISMFMIFSLNNYYKDYLPSRQEQRIAVHEKKANREAAAYVINNFREGDIVFHTHNHTTLPFEYYFNYYFKRNNGMAPAFNKEKIALTLEFVEEDEDPIAFETWSEFDSMLSRTTVPVAGHSRVWLVFSSREFKEACMPGSEERRKMEWMERRYIEKDVKHFKGINLYLFEKPKIIN